MNDFEPIRFPGTLVIVLSKALREDPRRVIHDGTTLAELHHALNGLAAQARLLARHDVDQRGGERLILHTERHVITLYPTNRGDAFRIGRTEQTTLATQARVAKSGRIIGFAGCLLLDDVRAIDQRPSSPSYRQPALWTHVRDALQETPAPADGRRERHLRYLDDVEHVIGEMRRLEDRKDQEAGVVNYRAFRTAREQRHSGRDVYLFDLVDRPTFDQGDTVQIDVDPPLRASVVRLTGRTATLRLRHADLSAIPPQGTLRVAAITAVYRAQEKAVRALRDGTVSNPRILDVLVDGDQLPFQPDTSLQPQEHLDSSQTDVFQRALAVHDQLLVLGPPGTGKTRVLTQIAAAAVARGEKVLLASQANRAVDNVLERLPDAVRAVRTGNEDSVAMNVRDLFVSAQAESIRRDLHEKAERNLFLHNSFRVQGVGTHGVFELLSASEAVAGATELVKAAEEAVDAVERTALAALEHRPWWQLPSQLIMALRISSSPRARAERELARQSALDNDPEVQDARSTYAAATQARARAQNRSLQAAGTVAHELALALPDQDLPDIPDPTGPGLPDYLARIGALAQLATRRALLLEDWLTQIDSSTQLQERELLQYADVVATTCTGAGNEQLDDVDFDLALIDEAGQIATPNLIVPLVKARRHILVGDDRQLPPVVDEGIEEELAEGRRSDLVALLRRSTFQDLYRRGPHGDPHRPMLRVQRRMPNVLAAFISAQFYEGSLQTDNPIAPTDPVFRSPIAFVSTSDRTEQRHEKKTRAANGRASSYTNDLEAELVVRLIADRQSRWPERAIIVPYKAQRKRIMDVMAKRLGEARSADVGTVDAFQGGERDLIVFSFTRSNNRGSIGFLKELRRLNVAMTRAKQQLILVGDLDFLCSVTDEPFRRFMHELVTYLHAHGDLRTSSEFLAPESRS